MLALRSAGIDNNRYKNLFNSDFFIEYKKEINELINIWFHTDSENFCDSDPKFHKVRAGEVIKSRAKGFWFFRKSVYFIQNIERLRESKVIKEQTIINLIDRRIVR